MQRNHKCGNYRNFFSHFSHKNFVKPTLLLKKLLWSSFHAGKNWWKRISHLSTAPYCNRFHRNFLLFVKSKTRKPKYLTMFRVFLHECPLATFSSILQIYVNRCRTAMFQNVWIFFRRKYHYQFWTDIFRQFYTGSLFVCRICKVYFQRWDVFVLKCHRARAQATQISQTTADAWALENVNKTNKIEQLCRRNQKFSVFHCILRTYFKIFFSCKLSVTDWQTVKRIT